MPLSTIDRLCDELVDFGAQLDKLIKNNRTRLADVKDDIRLADYLTGKIDAYEVAYEDYIRRLKKVNSYRRTV